MNTQLQRRMENYRGWLEERGVEGLAPLNLFHDAYGGLGLQAGNDGVPEGHVLVIPQSLQMNADKAGQLLETLAGATIHSIPETGIDKDVLGCQSDGSEGILEDEAPCSGPTHPHSLNPSRTSRVGASNLSHATATAWGGVELGTVARDTPHNLSSHGVLA